MKIRLVGKPKNAPYLTPGKVYPAVLSDERSAVIVDDEGDEIGVDINTPEGRSCPHARPAHWEVVE